MRLTVVEVGETLEESLLREVLEETGRTILPETVVEFGMVTERRRDLFYRDRQYVCYSHYYLCQTADTVGPLHLTANERAQGYCAVYADAQEISRCNRSLHLEQWMLRDTLVIELYEQMRKQEIDLSE